jgi:hypothetical protein
MKNSGFRAKSKVSAFNKSLCQTESEVPLNPLLLIHANRYRQVWTKIVRLLNNLKQKFMKKIFTLGACLVVSSAFAQTMTFNATGSGRTGSVQQYIITGCITEITVDAYGAQGGNSNGGLGARIQGTFTVTAGDTIYIVVGQQGTVNECGGSNASSGGGGGSFVWKSNGPSRTLLLAAGGGGGGNMNWGSACRDGIAAEITPNGTQGAGGLSAVGGTGGNGGSGSAPLGTGSGGAGWLSAGGNSTYGTGCTGGLSWPLFAGGYGSTAFGVPGQGDGGFGGGGGAVCGNGGGGGYSGGGGGEGSTCRAGGGGGGSYNSGTDQTNTAVVRTGNGIVYITPNSSSASPTQPGAIAGSVAVCAGDNAVFGISSVPNADSYTWNIPFGATIISGQGTTSISVAFGSSSGTVSVVANNGCGSSQASNSVISVNPLPNVSLGSDFVTCGVGAVLDAGIPGATCLWNTGATTQTINISSSGSYSVIAIDANGCSDNDTINVILNENPFVNLGSDTVHCGTSIILDAGNFGSSFLWNNTSTSQTNTASASGQYIVTVTNVNNCTSSDTINVIINLLPAVSASASMTVVCQGGNDITLIGYPAGGFWSGPGVTGNTFNPSSSTGLVSLIYDYTDVNNCSNSDQVVVTVNEHSTATQTASGLDYYTWPVNGQTYSQSGTYIDVIPNTVGCDSTITLNLTLSFTGITENIKSNFTVFPNPASEVLNVIIPYDSNESYILFDSRGRMVIEGKLTGIETQISLTTITPAVYMLQIGKEKLPLRVIKE